MAFGLQKGASPVRIAAIADRGHLIIASAATKAEPLIDEAACWVLPRHV
jgi:hypothetical protein